MVTQISSKQIGLVWFLLRFGVAFTFLYASISAFINPAPWLGYFPDFMRAWQVDNLLLTTWGSGEFVIGVWLLSGYRIFLPSVAAAGLMLGIFLTDFDSLNIIFRNPNIIYFRLFDLAFIKLYHKFYNLL